MNIGLYGDSTQVGVSVYGGTVYTARWTVAKLLQAMLDAEHGVGVHTVSNYGIGGSTIASAVGSGIFPGGLNFSQHMAQQSDDIVVANWGINDAYTPGYTSSQHKANYAALKTLVEGEGKVFIYESPNPLSSASGHDAIMSANDAAVKTISGVNVADINTAIKTWYPQWSSHLSDGTHPNSIMYGYISMALLNSLEAYL